MSDTDDSIEAIALIPSASSNGGIHTAWVLFSPVYDGGAIVDGQCHFVGFDVPDLLSGKEAPDYYVYDDVGQRYLDLQRSAAGVLY